MPRKIRGNKQTTQRRMGLNEKILFIVSAIVALSMAFGYIASALSR